MMCPRGSPRLTSIPLRTTNGLRTRALVSIAGTSTCQPERSLPLKRLCGWRSDAQRDVEPKAVVTQTARIRNDFMRAGQDVLDARSNEAQRCAKSNSTHTTTIAAYPHPKVLVSCSVRQNP